MIDYETRGTPWTIIIGPDRKVRSEGFRIDEHEAIAIIDDLICSTSEQEAEVTL